MNAPTPSPEYLTNFCAKSQTDKVQYNNNTNTLADEDFLSAIKEKYHVLDIFQLTGYDYQFDLLEQRLRDNKKDQFDQLDRIIVVHFDTDYYIHNQFGINLINLFSVWRQMDIPLHVMLLYTNNIGIGKEIDIICQESHVNDRPTLIETFINPKNYSSDTYANEPELHSEQIEYHGLSMMGAPRSHRYALYNHLKHLSSQLALVIKGQP